MKPPKEPKSFKWPRMYAVFCVDTDQYCTLRIIEPDGTAHWFGGFGGTPWGLPCWSINGASAELQVELMKTYDKGCGDKTVFIGEIK